MTATSQPEAAGRRRLIEAALRLAARKRSFTSIGLRELAREAGLNPNTFYRHFRDLDDLGIVITGEISAALRSALSEIRQSAVGVEDAARRTIEYFFDFVRRNPEAFLIGARELHGASPAMRRALRQANVDMAMDMATDMRTAGLVTDLDADALHELATMIVQQMFYLSLDYVEHPRERRAIVDRAVRFILTLAAGTLALRAGDGASSAASDRPGGA